MTNYKQNLWYVLTFLCLLAIAGCGTNVRVSGTVTFSDGTPLEKGKITFENDRVFYFGKIQKNGSFSLGVIKDGQGIPPGKYRVAVDSYEVEGKGLEEVLIHFVAKKFRDSSTSDIEYDITGKTTNLAIVVDKPETGSERQQVIPRPPNYKQPKK
ncbi:MAG: hypothetical protein LBP87_14415 [Planctomycetaceae bacterium]|jgi:hypothetical protein|nr:hypothetical protein [Planctomycetaceae bacterium]